MKTIHLAGLGVAGIGLARCLKGHYQLQGHDASNWAELLAKDEDIATEPNIGEQWHADMIIPTPDPLVLKYARGTKAGFESPDDKGSDLCFLPDIKQIELCQDKAKTAEVLGDLAPKTFWVRDTQGAGGKGAQMCSEYLPGRNVSVEFAWHKGNLLGFFTKERISYSLIKKTSGLEEKGSSVVSICIEDKEIQGVALNALKKVGQYTTTGLHGFYGVDLKQNELGEWKVTEINAGRLLTASYTYFYKTGYNLALAGVKAFFGESYELGEYPEGWGMLRTTDREPLLCPPEVTKDWR